MEPVKRTPTPSEIKYAIAVAAGCDPDELPMAKKTHRMTLARYAWYRLLRKHTDMTYEAIGFDANRDHTTIMNGVKPRFSSDAQNARIDRIVECAESVLDRIMSSGAVGAVVTKETVETMYGARSKR